MSALITLLVLIVVVALVLAIVQAIAPDPVVQKWVRVVVLLILLFTIVGWFFGGLPAPFHR